MIEGYELPAVLHAYGRRYVRADGGLLVASALAYLSRTQHRGVSPQFDAVQDLIGDLKDGDPAAVARGAAALARHPALHNFRGVVVPVPRSADTRPRSLELLARLLVQQHIGTRTAHMVRRATPVESSRLRRRAGLPGVSYEEHVTSMAFVDNDVPLDAAVLLVDDVFTVGTTLRAAATIIRTAGHRGTIAGATVGYYVADPHAVNDPYTFTVQRV